MSDDITDNSGVAIQKSDALIVHDAPNAPIIYFDNAPYSAFVDGILHVSLVVPVLVSANTGFTGEARCVAHLKCTAAGAAALRAALNKALLVAAPVEGKAN